MDWDSIHSKLVNKLQQYKLYWKVFVTAYTESKTSDFNEAYLLEIKWLDNKYRKLINFH